MGDRPRVTVMMTVYNGAPYIAEAIESILDQEWKDVEVVVVDDGSDDASGDIAAGLGPRVRVERTERRGMGAARNRALELASGELLAFLDADDRMVPGALERLVRALDDDDSLDVVYAHVREFVSPDVDEETRATLRPAADRIPGRLPTTMLCRRGAFLRVGGFPTHLKMGIGMDWAARAEELPLRSTMLPDVLFERRLHGQNNGLRERDRRTDYVRTVKAALDRRRARESGLRDSD
jgi:glycosyltransferase involved in cell wall biosynthesis